MSNLSIGEYILTVNRFFIKYLLTKKTLTHKPKKYIKKT